MNFIKAKRYFKRLSSNNSLVRRLNMILQILLHFISLNKYYLKFTRVPKFSLYICNYMYYVQKKKQFYSIENKSKRGHIWTNQSIWTKGKNMQMHRYPSLNDNCYIIYTGYLTKIYPHRDISSDNQTIIKFCWFFFFVCVNDSRWIMTTNIRILMKYLFFGNNLFLSYYFPPI